MSNPTANHGQRDFETKIMDRVQGLIDKAASTDSDSEREALLGKADQLMQKHAFDQGSLNARKSRDVREKPISLEIAFPKYGPWSGHFSRMISRIARNARVRAHRSSYDGTMILVGFADDVDYAQMVWLSVYLGFTSKLDPIWDTSKSVDENVKILKEAGRKWAAIAELANAHGFECKSNDGKLKAAYRRQCIAEGVEPQAHTQRHEAYRSSFADYFQAMILQRLDSQKAKQQEFASETNGAELVLRDRGTEVDEEFWAMFPDLRPLSAEAAAAARAKNAAYWAAEEQKEAERRAKLTPKQRDAEDAAEARRAAAQQKAWEREDAKRFDRKGASAGRAAGAKVDLSGGKNSVAGNTTREIGN